MFELLTIGCIVAIIFIDALILKWFIGFIE
jgi:hypothetical protein